MKLLFRRFIGFVVIVGVLYSCASIGRIEGGPIDETPPRFITGMPLPGSLNNTKKKITILFDEFIKLDKANEKIVISPPQVQQPEIKANGKRVAINLQDTLKSNTTYTIDFADAIQDNNEGNALSDFSYTFSTGSVIDSMMISGFVLNASNLEPVKGLLVGLHSDLSDSAFIVKPFDRVGRTDSRGHFSIRGVAPGKYHIFALEDADQNFAYNQPVETIAFNDSLVVPSMEERVRQDTIWKDSLTVDSIVKKTYTYYLPDDVLLRCFKKSSYAQRFLKGERLDPRIFSLYFAAPADTLPILKGLNFDEHNAFVIDQANVRNDSIHYWIKDSLLYKKDTLQISLTYLYTDTLNQLVPRTDTLNLFVKNRPKTKKKKKESDKQKADSIEFLPVDVYAPGTMDVYDYITFNFSEPVARIDTLAIHLRQKVDSLLSDVHFDFLRDSIDVKRYNLFVNWKPGGSYTLEVDSMAFHSLYGLYTDKIKKEFKVKKLEDYGQIFFNVTGETSPSFVELLDAQDKVVRTVPIVDGKADFYYLNPGKYGARLIEDLNGNGVWDTGDYSKKLQPENVYYYPQVLEFKANFDLIQDWNIKGKALDKQKPNELKKQKPDENKKKKKNSGQNRPGSNYRR